MDNALSFALWAIIIGVLLISMVLSATLLKRLPLSTAMLYLGAGIGLGPLSWGLLTPNLLLHPLLHPLLLERLSEVAVLISLFAAGLKLGFP